MNNSEMWANLYTQEASTIAGRNVWHYLVDTAIGQIHIVAYECKDMQIKRYIFDSDNDKAERMYKKVSRGMIDGKF